MDRLRFKCLWSSEVNMPPDLEPGLREPRCGAAWAWQGEGVGWGTGFSGQAFMMAGCLQCVDPIAFPRKPRMS